MLKYTQTIFEIKETGEGGVEGFGFVCSEPCGFRSTGWHTEAIAAERAAQHADEHMEGQKLARGEIEEDEIEGMPPIDQFISERGLDSSGRGVVRSASKT